MLGRKWINGEKRFSPMLLNKITGESRRLEEKTGCCAKFRCKILSFLRLPHCIEIKIEVKKRIYKVGIPDMNRRPSYMGVNFSLFYTAYLTIWFRKRRRSFNLVVSVSTFRRAKWENYNLTPKISSILITTSLVMNF